MRVVHDDNGVMVARELEDVGQLGDRSSHRKNAVRPDDAATGGLRAAQLFAQIAHVAVLVHAGRALRDRLRQSHRVDDRRVIELIGYDEVAFLGDVRGEALVRVPGGDVGQRRLRADEARQRGLELPVYRERAADEANAARSRSELVQRITAGFHDPRLVA